MGHPSYLASQQGANYHPIVHFVISFAKGESMKKNIVLVLVLFCALSFVLTMSQAQTSRAFSSRTAFHNETGALRFVGANPTSPIVVPAAVAPGLTAADSAAAILDVYAPQFGVANPRQDLRVTQTYGVDNTRLINRYQQYYNGVPVIGGQLVVSTTRTGGLLSINGEASPDLNLNTTPRVDSARAQQAAVAWAAREFGYNVSELVAGTPELSVYDSRLMGPLKHPVQLVWNIEVHSTTLEPLRAMVLVNAHKGGIALGFNTLDDKHDIVQDRIGANSNALVPLPSAGGETSAAVPSVDTRAPGTADMETYDANSDDVLPGTLLCNETQQPCTNGAIKDADDAHQFGKDSYDYYWEAFGRDSIDDEGLLLRSTVRFTRNGGQYCNAFWNGQQMVYGLGCDIAADDVVGHELTHGVTFATSRLFYYYQSGAINESLSDVFGEFVDLTNAGGNDSPSVRWVVGEDTPLTAPDGTPGLRFMNNPPKDGLSPDRIQSNIYHQYEYGDDFWDNGGVHINSGVNNKAAYLMTDGGTFNGITVQGLGIEKVAAIYYDAQTTKLVSGSDYNDLYEILYQSCLDLATGGNTRNITVSDCDQVTNATQAVEMHLLPLNDWSAPEAEVCPAGQSANVLFSDDFESGDSKFTTGALLGDDAWITMEELELLIGRIYAHSGKRAWLGDDYVGGPNDSYLATANSIAIPSGAYLRFAHSFLLDYTFNPNVLYDGGIVEYSTDGTTWTQLDTVDSGQDYVGPIASGSGNPLAGKWAFSYDSHGYVSTRFDLSDLAGQNVKFRWRLGTDSEVAFYGWFVDDIEVYTCGGTQNPTETPAPGETPGPTPTSQPSGSTELVDNGGFEQVDGNGKPVVTPWIVKNSTGDKALCNKPGKAPVAATGNCAFRFKGGPGELGAIQQNLNITGVDMAEGDKLDFSVNLNVPGSSIGKIKVIVKYSDGTPATKISGSPVTTEGYVTYGDDTPLASSNVSKIKVGFSNRSASGKFYIDDVSVVHTPAGAGFADSGLLPLPGGEDTF